MADEKTPWNATLPRDPTEPVDLENHQESQGEDIPAARPDKPTPHGRAPLFGT